MLQGLHFLVCKMAASSSAKKFGCGLAAALLLALSVGFLIATIVIAVIGVELANDTNQCSSANLENNTSCENLSTLGGRATILNNTSTTDPPVEGSNTLQPINEREYLYWLAGATGIGVVWSVVNTFALWGLMAVLVWFHEKESAEIEAKDKTDGTTSESPEGIELQPVGGGVDVSVHPIVKKDKDKAGSDQPDSKEPKVVVKIDKIGKYIVHEWDTTPIRNFDPLSLVALFFSSLCFIATVLCLMWGVAISFNHARRSERTVDAYIIVEFVVAIFLPIFLFISAIFFASVLEFITVGHIDGRTAINRFLPSVSFLEGEKNNYWVIEKSYYFPLKKKTDLLKHGCWYATDRDWSTWFLVVIICVSFHLAISYFVDITLDQQVTVGSCEDPRIDRSFDCFHAGTLDFIDCTDENETFAMNATLFCFRFYRFGVDVDLISSLATSFAFYLATVGLFTQIFSVVKILLHIKRSKFWGIGFLFIGFLALGVAIVTTIFWVFGYASDTVGELRRLNIINIAQFFMVAIFMLMVGSLLISGKWYTKQNPKDMDGKTLVLERDGDPNKSDPAQPADKDKPSASISDLDAPPTNISASTKPK